MSRNTAFARPVTMGLGERGDDREHEGDLQREKAMTAEPRQGEPGGSSGVVWRHR